MIELNGKQYSLCLLDTNIVSELFKKNELSLSRFVNLISKKLYIPCFSIFTVLELRQRKDIYNKFLELFSILPCAFLKSHEQLLDDEIVVYPKHQGFNPILVTSPGMNLYPQARLDIVLEKLFLDSEILNKERVWNSSKKQIVEGINSLKVNFLPKQAKYSNKEIRQFIEIAGFEQIVRQRPKFAKQKIETHEEIQIDAFPSLKMILFSVFCKFYVDARIPAASDAFDLLISSAIPYIDVIVTENHQAEVIRKTKGRDDFISHVKVFRSRDFLA